MTTKKPTTVTQKKDLGASLKELEKIAHWFEEQEEVNVQEGIAKAKEGAALIMNTRKQLQEVENEFKEIKKILEK